MFWGLIMEPNKRYTQVVEKPFHISQAAMDTSMGDNEPCQVMVVVDEKNFLICTLQKGKHIQMNLDLYFKQGESIAFLTNGKSNVHLTGYLDPDFEEDLEEGEEEESEEEEEAPELVPTKNKRKIENSIEAPSSKKLKQEKKPKKVAVSNSNDLDSDDQLQKLLSGKDVDSDENDESFKLNTSTEADSSDDEGSDDEEDPEEDESEEEEKTEEEAETTLETSKEETVDISKISKSKRRRLAKKLAQQAKAQDKGQPQVNGVDKTKKKEGQQKAENQQQKKKAEGKKETQVGQTGEKKEKKTLSGGVFIEDLKVGDGPVAKAGKTVMVYYEGRLKQNNKMFDNCAKGPGFKFRLGGKEVISGWDVGVVGMKVGGRRKIVCPPNMAYGAKGTPPVIPPNSTLLFEVELKNVK